MLDTSNAVMNATGLSDEECKEVHAQFMKGLMFWVVASFIAHALVWSWMPWFPGGN